MKSPNEEAVARGYKDVLEWLLDDGDDQPRPDSCD